MKKLNRTLTIDHNNGHKSEYQLFDVDKGLPVAYRTDTPQELINVLERARTNRNRIKIYLGDKETGKSWNEENDVTGYIGLCKGYEAYFPILVYNERSLGGGSLMDNWIIKVRQTGKNGKTLYQIKNFIPSIVEIVKSDLPEYEYNTIVNGELHGRHYNIGSAEICKNKIL